MGVIEKFCGLVPKVVSEKYCRPREKLEISCDYTDCIQAIEIASEIRIFG